MNARAPNGALLEVQVLLDANTPRPSRATPPGRTAARPWPRTRVAGVGEEQDGPGFHVLQTADQIVPAQASRDVGDVGP